MDTSKFKMAEELHNMGMNCAQAVVCTYCEDFGIDKKTAFMMAEGFGAGMGSMKYTCGALSGLIMLLGLKNSSGNPNNPTKAETYKIVKEVMEKFKSKNNSVICEELKGLNGNKQLRTCSGCIEDACAIFEEYILDNNEVQEIK